MYTITLFLPTAAPPALRVSLWMAQVVLFLVFGVVGFMKISQPIRVLSRTMAWVADAPVGMVRFTGVSELAGALGVLLPALTGIAPWLTPLAAAGLVTVMFLAVLVHLARGELSGVALPMVLGVLSAFVTWGRFYAVPIG